MSRAVLSKKFPQWNVLSPGTSLQKNLNFYTTEFDSKELKEFALTYYKKAGKALKEIQDLPPHNFSTVGKLCHMLTRGVPLLDEEINKVESWYERLIAISKAPEHESEVVQSKDAKPKFVPRVTLINEHIGAIEGAFDDFVISGTEFDLKAFISMNFIKGPNIKAIANVLNGHLVEFNQAYDGVEPYQEAYGQFGRRQLKKVINLLEEWITVCNVSAVVAKTTATNPKKTPPPSKLVENMKWCKEFDIFKSVFPERIIGVDEVWMYDHSKRRLHYYVALPSKFISVRGTTLLNWDPEKSGSKIIRKPEVLKDYKDLTKKAFHNIFNGIKATLGIVNGRTNDAMLILKSY